MSPHPAHVQAVIDSLPSFLKPPADNAPSFQPFAYHQRHPMSYMFIGLSALIGLYLFFNTALNTGLFLRFNHLLNEALPADIAHHIWANLTLIGDGLIAACILCMILAKSPRTLLWIIVSAVLIALFIQIPKHSIGALRPPGVLDADTFYLVGHAIKRVSFPSGHTGTSFLIAGLLFVSTRNIWLRSLVISIAAIGGLSRIAVGVHWPADLFMGASIGMATAFLVSHLAQTKLQQLKQKGTVAVYAFMLILGIGGFFHDTGYEDYYGVTELRWIISAFTVIFALYYAALNLLPTFLRLSDKYLPESINLLIQRLLKFGAVGASGFVVDIALYSMLTSMFGVNLQVARVIAYWFTSSWNWYLNRKLTFSDAKDDKHAMRQWTEYLIMCVISFVPSYGTFYLLTENIAFFAQYSQIALILGVIAGAVFNFTGASLFIFKVYDDEDENKSEKN